MANNVLVSENSVRLSEVRRLIRYIEQRNDNYGRDPAFDPLLKHLRQRRDLLKKKGEPHA